MKVTGHFISAKLDQFIAFGVKDTDEGGGYDGHDGTDRDGLLSILQVTRTVRTSHDTCDTHTVYVTLDHKTSLKSLGYICSNSQKYIVWVKIIDFPFMPKIIRILSKDHVP